MNRTREVLDAIDGALDDLSVSDDAMRWNPDRREEAARRRIVTRDRIRAQQAIVVPPRLDPEQLARAVERYEELGEVFRPAFEVLRRILDEFGGSLAKAVEAIRPALLHTDADRIPPPARTLRDTDPRAYALELLRSRNTGPDRQVQRRPGPRRLP